MGGEVPSTEPVERALAWALARCGASAYAGRCLAFVEDAYERANGIEVYGGASAAESAQIYGTQPLTGVPPRGALVFFTWRGEIAGVVEDWGHVGISLGDGALVHAWDVVRIDPIEAIAHLPSASGWAAPSPLGWTPVARLLAGSRPRDWTDA
jgi:cell wall-associated NlpC family hydrolase